MFLRGHFSDHNRNMHAQPIQNIRRESKMTTEKPDDDALERQRIGAQLLRCQRSNAALAYQLAGAQDTLQTRSLHMQSQIAAIRGTVDATQRDLLATNEQLHGVLCSTVRTTQRLALMYLRMREARREAEKRARFFERLAHAIGASVGGKDEGADGRDLKQQLLERSEIDGDRKRSRYGNAYYRRREGRKLLRHARKIHSTFSAPTQ